ncbi:hypothetical protein V8J08_005604 [Citrobacter amalonaticus]
MEKVKSVDAVEFTAADKKAMTHAAYAQCFFILAYSHAWRSLNNIHADHVITSMSITQ